MKNLKKYDITSQKPIESWDEAIPLGCGKLGSLIYGSGPIKIATDRADLWDNRPGEGIYDEGFTFENLVRLSTSGKDEDWWGERKRLFEDVSRRHPYPSKLTAGRIELDFGKTTDNVHSHLSLEDAFATVTLDGGELGRIEAFLSATDYIGAMRVYGSFTADLHIPTYLSGDENGEFSNNSGISTVTDGCMKYPRCTVVRDGEYIYYDQHTLTDYRFGTVALIKKRDGYHEIYYTVSSTDDGADFISSAKRSLASYAERGFDELKRAHTEWWHRYWSLSQISLGDELFERTYYRSYYLFASCSRTGFPPMPLQGVWTADNDSIPPWNGDYHHDTNTQLSYQSYLKANRMDEGRVFVDFIWNMRDTFRAFAESFYHVKGLIIPATMSLDGKPIGGWAQYTLSPTMTIWVAESFDEYRLYTADEEFLKERAYPFFREVADAISALLRERDGKLYLPISSSPEIYDNRKEAYLEPNSNFDLALLIYLFKTLKEYCDILGLDGQKYADILAKLDPIAINGENMVMLDKKQNLTESHRHFSHLMCLYPLHLINYDTDEHKRIYESTMLNLERLGTGWWVGFSFAMCAQLYAMMHNGGAAYEKLRTFCKGCVSDNGFHLNGDFKHLGFSQWHYRPFTLESLFGYCDALQEMLLQEHNGYIEVFPAIPEEWERRVSFKRLRSYGGVLVDAEYKNGATRSLTVTSKKQITLRILNNFACDTLSVKSNKNTYTIQAARGEVFTVTFDGKIRIGEK